MSFGQVCFWPPRGFFTGLVASLKAFLTGVSSGSRLMWPNHLKRLCLTIPLTGLRPTRLFVCLFVCLLFVCTDPHLLHNHTILCFFFMFYFMFFILCFLVIHSLGYILMIQDGLREQNNPKMHFYCRSSTLSIYRQN